MNGSLIQLLVLAGIAIFLILKLRSVLGTRDGFEKPPIPLDDVRPRVRRDFEVIEGGPDRDITDHVAEGSDSARALAEMKKAEPAFAVGPFLQGARGAYEMILMAFEKGELDRIRPFLSDDVEASFAEAIAQRERDGLTIEASFLGIKELVLHDATFTPKAASAKSPSASSPTRPMSCATRRGKSSKAPRVRSRRPATSGPSPARWGPTTRTGSLSPPATDALGCAARLRILARFRRP
jgi:hypothetical protein